MSQIDDLFTRLKQQGKKAFLPFVTAGDPDLQVTAKVLETFDALGCSMAEVGIPYSDPIADGPVIQASYTRALNAKTTLTDILKTVEQTRPKIQMPLACMVSYSICHRIGLEKFVQQAIQAGFSGAIVPDLLVEESDAMATICRANDFSLIQLVTPTTRQERAIEIAERTSGFLYFVSVTGITGARTELAEGLVDRIRWLKDRVDVPICIGFGISKPEHIQTLAPIADGVIVGSAIVKLLSGEKPDHGLGEVESLVKSLVATLEQSTTASP